MGKTIQQLIDEVRSIERAELREALIRKGKRTGSGFEYEFEDTNRPVIAAYSYDVPADVIIMSVGMTTDGILTIIGYNNDDTGSVHKIKPDDIFVGQMEFITSNIK